MSADLTKARQQLNGVRALLKQKAYVAAAQSVHFGLGVFLKSPLMKAEKGEFEVLIGDATALLSADAFIREKYAVQLVYEKGKEKDLYSIMRELVTILSDVATEEAQEMQRLRELKKNEWFERGVAELQSGDLTKGQATLVSLLREFRNDATLKGAVGEALVRVALYEPAITYLTEAIDEKPEMLPLYNLIGMALRRLKQFKTAENYYLRASTYLRNDPNLYFNIGRLYLDWDKWPKAAKAAEVALKLDPDFVEAQKLLKYVNKKIAQNAEDQ